MVEAFPKPTRAEQVDFLLRLFFGPESDRLAACVKRGYRDLNRTMHGVARFPRGAELRERAVSQVRCSLANLRDTEMRTQDAFDGWHRLECERLCSLYTEHGFLSFTIGQAQKWFNMAFKYVYVFGEEQIPGFGCLYHLGHVPLDNIMLSQFEKFDAPALSTRWSRLRDYDEYFRFQQWIRQRFDSAPLAVEFRLWRMP
jgi:hypothetical protein